MRVLQILTSIDDESAGPSYSVTRLAKELAKQGEASELVCLGPRDTKIMTAEGALFATYKSGGSIPRISNLLGASTSLRRAITNSAEQGAVLHSHGLWRLPNVYPGLEARKAGVPLIVSPRGMLGAAALSFSKTKKSVFWHLAQRRSLDSLTCFHATAQSEVDDIRSFGLEQPVAVIPNGIDIPCASNGSLFDDTDRSILYLGRIHPKKGIERLIQAWALLGTRTSGWKLKIVGPLDSSYAQNLSTETSARKLVNISFEGPLFGSEKDEAFRKAGLFVLPTQHENFGMVVAEALAWGTPVVCTQGAPWEGLRHNDCGWWVGHQPEDLAEAIGAALELSVEQRNSMGLKGREWMKQDFSWTGVGEKMRMLYGWCLGVGPKPDFIFE